MSADEKKMTRIDIGHTSIFNRLTGYLLVRRTQIVHACVAFLEVQTSDDCRVIRVSVLPKGHDRARRSHTWISRYVLSFGRSGKDDDRRKSGDEVGELHGVVV